ncbi:MAG TPA: hypothetical protein VHE81_22415 [Lacipirellulaceae bacterium]|nr:hypothetical protein [Lacipirellulaceae bacterium]
MMADPASKWTSTPATGAAAASAKRPPDKLSAMANESTAKSISRGLLSLLVGSVALSLYSVPYLLVRVVAVLTSLGGIGLAVFQFRTEEKSGRNFNGALVGTLFCSAVIVLTAIGPYLPTPGPRIARPRLESGTVLSAPSMTSTNPRSSPKSQREVPIVDRSSADRSARYSEPAPPTSRDENRDTKAERKPMDVATHETKNDVTGATSTLPYKLATKSVEDDNKVAPQISIAIPQPVERPSGVSTHTSDEVVHLPPIPSNMPKVIPFPCRKSFRWVSSDSPNWIDAATTAALQGEVAVCIVSATTERLDLTRGGTTSSSKDDNLVIHLEVELVGSGKAIDFAGWGSANFGDARHRPELKDDANYVYELRQLVPGTKVVDHERSKSLYPQLYADDYLIYEPPRSKVESLRLELPASAFGGIGTLHFQIPKSMIESK